MTVEVEENLVLEELLNHKYFKRLVPLILEHPYSNELTSLHASLIVRGGSILASGINEPNPNGFALSYAYHNGFQLHSECATINKVRRKINLKGCTMYNCRITKNGKVNISRPCQGCSLMLMNYGFKKIVYSTEFGFAVEKVSNLIKEI